MASRYALVVDDEPANLEFIQRLLQTANLTVVSANSKEQMLRVLPTIPSLAIALVDHELPDSNGVELVMLLRASYPHAVLVMATMHDNREIVDKAFKAGIDIFLVKPHGFMDLYKRILATSGDLAENKNLHELIIDQYGPRTYRKRVQTAPLVEPTIAPQLAEPAKQPAEPNVVLDNGTAPEPKVEEPLLPSSEKPAMISTELPLLLEPKSVIEANKPEQASDPSNEH